MCSILHWILSIWEALGWHFFIFWLDSCIVNKGEKFELELACCTHLEGFQVVSSYFWAQAVSQVASAWLVRGTDLTGVVPRCWAILSTGLTGEGDRSDWSELSCCSCSASCGDSHAFVQGELHWSRGSLRVCRGSSLWFFEHWIGGLRSLLEHSFLSDVSSRCPCLRGLRLVFFKWSFSLAFDRLLEFLFIRFFSFLSLSGYYMCVLSMHSSRGRLRTMCGSRTGRWSLPGVMSDWQHCVDWFLAKYCRCRLQLDWCWCRWRTSAKGRCRWGL
jgi:hypothetical protein